MNLTIFGVVLIVLTVMHPIGDFLTPYRKWGKGWKQFFVSEWFLVLNPLHALWDAYSPLRRHPKYLESVKMAYPAIDWEGNTEEQIVVRPLFWRWLAVDQLYHMLSNILVAWTLGILL